MAEIDNDNEQMEVFQDIVKSQLKSFERFYNNIIKILDGKKKED